MTRGSHTPRSLRCAKTSIFAIFAAKSYLCTAHVWNRRFLHLRGHYRFHATACTPATPREKGSVEAAVR
jgi:transposase